MERIRRKSFVVSGERWKLRGNFSARIVWEGRRIWRRLGWSVVVALACFSLALLVNWQTHLLFKEQQLLALQLQAVQFAAAAKPVNEANQLDSAHQLEAFYAYLPEHDAIPDQLKQLINLAQKSGVTLSKAEYKPQPEVNADFLRYQIVFPVKANYPNIQTFILSALKELPTLILESVAFKRERIESGEVEARIQCTLLVKKPFYKGGQR